MNLFLTTQSLFVILIATTNLVHSFRLLKVFGAMKREGTSILSNSKSDHSSTKEKNFFAKYEGLGNDFILVDNTISAEPLYTPEQAVKICNR